MTRPQTLPIPKVSRIVLADGDCHEVACAVVDDGEGCPVRDLLAELQEGVWQEPDIDEYPDQYQVKYGNRLLALAEALANGDELPAQSFNFLSDGVWELKISKLRVTFFDTDGRGSWNAKGGTRVTDTWDGKPRYELPDDFDEFLRLGHHFGKAGQKTEDSDIQKAFEVREEDVNYDKAAA